jgi:uncharacterized protein
MTRTRKALLVLGVALAAWLLASLAWFLFPVSSEAASPTVIDDAGLLTASEEADLTARIADIQSRRGVNVLIYTAQSIGSSTPQSASQAQWTQGGYGADGISFLVAMGSRDWWIQSYGWGLTAFNDYGRETMGATCQPKLSAGDYYGAFSSFLDYVDAFAAQARSGNPYSASHPYHPGLWLQAIGTGFGLGAVIALIVVMVWKRQLKTARPEKAAYSYEVPDSLQFSVRDDQFVSTHTQVIPLPRDDHQGGGGHSFGGGGGGSFGGMHSSGGGTGGKF